MLIVHIQTYTPVVKQYFLGVPSSLLLDKKPAELADAIEPGHNHDVLRQRKCWDLNEITSNTDSGTNRSAYATKDIFDEVYSQAVGGQFNLDNVLDSMCADPPSSYCAAGASVPPGGGSSSSQEQHQTENSGWNQESTPAAHNDGVLRKRKCWDLNEISESSDTDSKRSDHGIATDDAFDAVYAQAVAGQFNLENVLDSMSAAPKSSFCAGDSPAQPGGGSSSSPEDHLTDKSGRSDGESESDVWKEDHDGDSCGTTSSWEDLTIDTDNSVFQPTSNSVPAAFTTTYNDFVHRAEKKALGKTSSGTTRSVPCTGERQDWRTIPLPDERDWVLLEHVPSERSYRVSTSQLRKAKARLNEESCISVLTSGTACRCTTKKCHQHFSVADLMKMREVISTQRDEVSVSSFLVQQITSTRELQPGRTSYIGLKLGGRSVCRTFFCKAYGISDRKLRGVVSAVLQSRNPLLAVIKRKVAKPTMLGERVKFNQAFKFWNDFFNDTCQTPKEGMRLFPVNLSMRIIYEEYFKPWFKRIGHESARPGMRSFERARKHEAFSDVKRRKNHQHCRCNDCKTLDEMHLQAYKEHGMVSEAVRSARLAHRAKVAAWRRTEETWYHKAAHCPQEVNVFSYDDTSTFGAPHFTNRCYKGLPNARVEFIPFLIKDHARGKDTYIYSVKNRYKKGANRLVTTLNACIRALKSDLAHAARHANKLVLIADNYSENKNNTMFAFCTHLILEGVYDEVEMLFGPVGHTHNGVDQKHDTHNNSLGSFTNADLAHLISRYILAWPSAATRPGAAVLDVQQNWDDFYKPYINRLGGFTNTVTDDVGVHAFQFTRATPSNVVEMRWKRDAGADLSWRGITGEPDSAPFVLLRSHPIGKPEVVPPTETTTVKEYFKQFTGRKIAEKMQGERIHAARKGLIQTMLTGVIPRSAPKEYRVPSGELGKLYTIGVPEVAQVDIRFIEAPAEGEPLWLRTTHNDVLPHYGCGDQASLLAAITSQRLPVVGYAHVPPTKRPVYKHANNVSYRENMESAAAASLADNESDFDADMQDVIDRLPSRAGNRRGEDARAPSAAVRRRVPGQRGSSNVQPQEDNRQDLPGDDVAEESVSENRSPPARGARGRRRRRGRGRGRGRGGRRNQALREDSGTIITEHHDVHAVFGSSEDGPREVWLFVNSSRGKIQYLAPAEEDPSLWRVLYDADEASNAVIRKTWKKTEFKVTGSARSRKAITVSPLPADEWKVLVEECEAYDLSDASSSDDTVYRPRRRVRD